MDNGNVWTFLRLNSPESSCVLQVSGVTEVSVEECMANNEFIVIYG